MIVLIASMLLIRSTRLRDHSNMMPFLIFMAIGVFLAFLQLLIAPWSGLAIAIVTASLEVYFFLCIYSLYSLFKDEYMRKNQPIQMLPMPLDTQPYGFNPQPTAYGQNPTGYVEAQRFSSQPTAFQPYQDEPPTSYNQMFPEQNPNGPDHKVPL